MGFNDDDLRPNGGGRFIVMCRVSGGVTGTREAELKKNGVVMLFDSREDAEATAARLMRSTNGNPYRTADFRYWVEER